MAHQQQKDQHQQQQLNQADLNKHNDNGVNSNELNEEEEIRYINPEYYNDDTEECSAIEKMALIIKPYFSPNNLPTSKYLQNTSLPLIYEALSQVDKMRPKEPIEFFTAYLLDRNKKQI